MNNFERARIVYKNENAILSHSYKKKKIHANILQPVVPD